MLICARWGPRRCLTRSDVPKGHSDYYQDLAIRIARETGAFYTDQFNNPNNPAAHERTTGPEIWAQLGENVDAVVAGVGSGGTITGLSRYFAKVSPETEMVLADPKGSILADFVHNGDYRRGWKLARRRHWRGLHSAGQRPFPRAQGLYDFGRRELRGGSDAA